MLQHNIPTAITVKKKEERKEVRKEEKGKAVLDKLVATKEGSTENKSAEYKDVIDKMDNDIKGNDKDGCNT